MYTTCSYLEVACTAFLNFTYLCPLWILPPVCGIGGGTRRGTMGPCSQNKYAQVPEQVTLVVSPGGTRSLTMVFCNSPPGEEAGHQFCQQVAPAG